MLVPQPAQCAITDRWRKAQQPQLQSCDESGSVAKIRPRYRKPDALDLICDAKGCGETNTAWLLAAIQNRQALLDEQGRGRTTPQYESALPPSGRYERGSPPSSPDRAHPERQSDRSVLTRRHWARLRSPDKALDPKCFKHLAEIRGRVEAKPLWSAGRQARPRFRASLDGHPTGKVHPAPEAVHMLEAGAAQEILIPFRGNRHQHSFQGQSPRVPPPQ